jgi:hypothetical protein
MLHIIGRLSISAFVLAIGLVQTSAPTRADGLEPENSLVVTSAKGAFPLDAIFPKEWWPSLDERTYFALTSLTAGQKTIAAAGTSLMTQPENTCSIYDSSVCFNTARFYQPDIPQAVLSGFFKADRDNAILFGLDTGFRSDKLTISPAVMIGLTHRHYLNDRRDAQILVEAAGWVGQSVSHRPCFDQYDRSYYCGNLSAWSDFSYDPHPSNLYLKLWFDLAL